MKQENKKNLYAALCLLAAFALWTAAVQLVDIQPIGPQNSAVGFATINTYFHNLTGVHMSLYTITDWLSVIPLCFVMGFGMLGLTQWIRRKHFRKVDYSILVLGGFYIVVLAAFLFFEVYVINYRPVLINGVLEASYPSSTTMLVMCVMITAMMQLQEQVRNKIRRRWILSGITVFTLFMVIGRLVSGVHWLTDIVGGALLSMGLVLLYRFISSLEVIK